MAQSVLSVRMDSNTKAAFARFCDEVGMSVSTAITLFARQTIRLQRIPFDISLATADTPAHTSTTIGALEQAELGRIVSDVASRYAGIDRVILFGSYARHEARPESDIDLRVEYREGSLSFIELADFSESIRELTGKDVDIISKRDLGDDEIARSIKRDGVVVYERTK